MDHAQDFSPALPPSQLGSWLQWLFGIRISHADEEFEAVLEQGRALQGFLPALGLIAVGGTAAAMHCRHRVSMDVDQVTPALRSQYREIVSALQVWPGWQTNRLNPPVLILGQRNGVELGIRQQRRTAPLQTTSVAGLRLPTAAELLRIKAYLLTERRATRDYIDVAALSQLLGDIPSLQALSILNWLYPSALPQTAITRFAEACEAEPLDRELVALEAYKGLRPPFTDWTFLTDACQRLGRNVLRLELSGGLPAVLPPEFVTADEPEP